MSKKIIYGLFLIAGLGIVGAGVIYIGSQAVLPDGQFEEPEPIPVVHKAKDAEASATSSAAGQLVPKTIGITGILKSVQAGQGLVIEVGGKDQQVLIATSTEVFRNGKRATLADIQKTDVVTVLGRENADASQDFTADTIYANSEPKEIPHEINIGL